MSANSNQLTVLPRPRSHWQAMDAGMLLARAHYWKLLALWLCFALPVALLSLSVLFFNVSFYLAVIIHWWFKPLYELPILIYLSHALFNEPITIRGALKESLGNLGRLFTSYLTLSRLSPSRSMTAPVVFLEKQKGKARRARVRVLTGAITRAYTLMIAWLNFEGIGVYALAGLIVAFAPHGYSLAEIGGMLTDGESIFGPFQTMIYGVLPMIMAALVAPLYVSGGFLLYINRRMRLEAWDIEHQFQDLNRKHRKKEVLSSLASHLTPVALAGAGLALCFMTLAPSTPVYAQSVPVSTPSVESVRQTTDNIYDSKEFGYTTESRRLVFKDDGKVDERINLDSPDINPSTFSDVLAIILLLAKYLIYFSAGVLIVIVLWGLMKYLPDSWQLAGRWNRHKPELDLLDVEHHPLTKSLPTDVTAAAQAALANDNYREVFSLLYRGALRTVMRRHGLSIPRSATERESQRWVQKCEQAEQTAQFNQIVTEWSQVAYADHKPNQIESKAAIDFWQRHFELTDNIEPTAVSTQ